MEGRAMAFIFREGNARTLQSIKLAGAQPQWLFSKALDSPFGAPGTGRRETQKIPHFRGNSRFLGLKNILRLFRGLDGFCPTPSAILKSKNHEKQDSSPLAWAVAGLLPVAPNYT